MTDRELLELAAKAADLVATPEGEVLLPAGPATGDCRVWNPLTDDGDALRLAVKLRMDIVHFRESVRADVTGYDDCHESNGDDPNAATRRAIVRAAVAIGGPHA